MPEESGVSGGSRMTGGKNILVVDDEQMIREALTSYLEKQGCHVFQAETGREALQVFQRESVSFVILDLLLPDLSGEEVCIQIRKESRVPVIMLTAKGTEYDKVLGLDSGADDYVAKPFGMMELLARVKALLRRTEQAESEEVYRLGALSVNKTRHEVYAAGQEVTLTLKEFDLLCLLLENKGRVLTRDQLLNRIWGYGFDGESRTVDVHIRTLRQKLGECGEYIETVRGVGYKVGGNI